MTINKDPKTHLINYIKLYRDNTPISKILSSYFEYIYGDTTLMEYIHLKEVLDKLIEMKASDYQQALPVALENAKYLKTYLEGNMYHDGITPKNNEIQIKNAQRIIDRVNVVMPKQQFLWAQELEGDDSDNDNENMNIPSLPVVKVNICKYYTYRSNLYTHEHGCGCNHPKNKEKGLYHYSDGSVPIPTFHCIDCPFFEMAENNIKGGD